MINHFFLYFSLLFGFLAPCSAQILSANRKEVSKASMDSFLLREIEGLEIPGLSIAFIRNRKIVYHRTLGYANLSDSIRVQPATLFQAASISKSVFSFYTLMLVDKGLIHLDTPLYKYLPYPDISYDERYKLITARMVMSHTSGFPNWREIPPSSAVKIPKKGDLYLNFLPGTQVNYSGEGFMYLAKVLAHIQGTDLAGLTDIINKTFLRKIGMSYSSFGWNDKVRDNEATGYLNAGGVNRPGERQVFKGVHPAAGLYSNANDFSRFLAILSNGKGLKKATYEEMTKEQSRPLTPSSERDAWGLGINLKQTANGIRYSHSGSNSSFTTFYSFYKDANVGYVFFLNNNMASPLITKLESFMATGEFPAEKKIVAVSAEVLNRYVGKYEVTPGVNMIISNDGGRIYFQQSNRDYKFEIFPESVDSFFFKLDPAEVKFIGKGNEIVEMQLKNGNGVSSFKRIN